MPRLQETKTRRELGPRSARAHNVTAGGFDFDNVGTLVAQYSHGARARDDTGQVDYLEARKWTASRLGLFHCWLAFIANS